VPAPASRPAATEALAWRDQRWLRRDIAVVLAVKLLILAALWFAFVRGREVTVDAERAAGLLGAAAHTSASSEGKRHGQ
jgi:hypothetical protein